MIFVDTGAWYAAAVPDDPDYAVAQAWLHANREPLITTDYVVDELSTLIKRGANSKGVLIGDGSYWRKALPNWNGCIPRTFIARGSCFPRTPTNSEVSPTVSAAS